MEGLKNLNVPQAADCLAKIISKTEFNFKDELRLRALMGPHPLTKYPSKVRKIVFLRKLVLCHSGYFGGDNLIYNRSLSRHSYIIRQVCYSMTVVYKFGNYFSFKMNAIVKYFTL